MDSLEKDYASGLWSRQQPPCLSLYQPTHRHHPDNRQDPLRFRNLVRSLEESLHQQHPRADARALLNGFNELAGNEAFWNHALDGLAVLAADDLFRVYRLQRPVPELAIAADTFHTKPLLRILQSADRYQVLALTRDSIRLFEGNRDQLDEVELVDAVPATLTEALGDELTEPHLTVASYGGVGRMHAAMHHGHGGRETEVEKDTSRYFRAVDRALLEHHSQPARLPLIVASLPQHRALFQTISRNPFLVHDGIDTHPDSLDAETLKERAWQAMEPHYLNRLATLSELFGSARGTGLALKEVLEVARAAVEGRVSTLLVDADRVIPGRIDVNSGAVAIADLEHPDVDDLLDDLGELVLGRGGEVVIVPRERMPSDTGVAAILRY